MSKLSNLQAQSLEDFPGAPDYFGDYMQGQNAFNRDVFNQVNGGLDSDNLVDKYVTVDLDHGVATRVKNPIGNSLVGVQPVRCIGVELGSNGQPSRTLYTSLGMPRIDWYPAATDTGQIIVTATYPRTVSKSAGEVIETYLTQANAVTLVGSPATAKTVTSVDLTAGTWYISGTGVLGNASSGATPYFVAAITTTANSIGTTPGYLRSDIPLLDTANDGLSLAISPQKVTTTATTTYYLGAQAQATSGTPKAYGSISAMRLVETYTITSPRGRVTLRLFGG